MTEILEQLVENELIPTTGIDSYATGTTVMYSFDPPKPPHMPSMPFMQGIPGMQSMPGMQGPYMQELEPLPMPVPEPEPLNMMDCNPIPDQPGQLVEQYGPLTERYDFTGHNDTEPHLNYDIYGTKRDFGLEVFKGLHHMDLFNK